MLRTSACQEALFQQADTAGSIGTQTLDIIREHKDRFELVALAAGGNVKLLAEQVSGRLFPLLPCCSVVHTRA